MFIYIIRTPSNPSVYIGSTSMPVKNRFMCHKSQYKAYLQARFQYCSSFDILQDPLAYIELLEAFEDITLQELKKKENDYIEQYKHICINRNRAYLDDATRKQQIKHNNEKRNYKFFHCDECNKFVKVRNHVQHENSKKHIKNVNLLYPLPPPVPV